MMNNMSSIAYDTTLSSSEIIAIAQTAALKDTVVKAVNKAVDEERAKHEVELGKLRSLNESLSKHNKKLQEKLTKEEEYCHYNLHKAQEENEDLRNDYDNIIQQLEDENLELRKRVSELESEAAAEAEGEDEVEDDITFGMEGNYLVEGGDDSSFVKEDNLVDLVVESEDEGEDEQEKNKQPLCICPECDKKLSSMWGLFGHYGVKHRRQVNHDEITYACPFCVEDPNDDETEFVVFENTDELEAHVDKEHKGCALLSSPLETSRPKSKSNPKPILSSTRRPTRSLPQANKYEPAPWRGGSTESKEKKAADALCKCPDCDKVFAPLALYGHFRVHTLQDNGSVFEWSNVQYACPFCPSDDDPKIYNTVDALEAHVNKSHSGCEVIMPNQNSTTGSVYRRKRKQRQQHQQS